MRWNGIQQFIGYASTSRSSASNGCILSYSGLSCVNTQGSSDYSTAFKRAADYYDSGVNLYNKRLDSRYPGVELNSINSSKLSL